MRLATLAATLALAACQMSAELPPAPEYDVRNRAQVPSEWETTGESFVSIGRRVMDLNRGLLASAPSRPTDVTIVTGIWNLGRGSMPTVGQWAVFKRPFTYYMDGLRRFLSYRLPKVVFCDAELYPQVKALADRSRIEGAGPVRIVIRSVQQLQAEFGLSDEVDRIRNSPAWRSQAETVANSPQALLRGFIPVVMSKLPLTRDVARWNPFKTTGFLWMDGALGGDHDDDDAM
jgi:hypothetical protein